MDKSSKEKLIEIVKAAKQGDKKAFANLYECYISPIFRFIYFRVKDYSDAEDLTQTVFLKAWNALPNYRQKKNPSLVRPSSASIIRSRSRMTRLHCSR